MRFAAEQDHGRQGDGDDRQNGTRRSPHRHPHADRQQGDENRRDRVGRTKERYRARPVAVPWTVAPVRRGGCGWEPDPLREVRRSALCRQRPMRQPGSTRCTAWPMSQSTPHRPWPSMKRAPLPDPISRPDTARGPRTSQAADRTPRAGAPDRLRPCVATAPAGRRKRRRCPTRRSLRGREGEGRATPPAE